VAKEVCFENRSEGQGGVEKFCGKEESAQYVCETEK